jgi:hypothetical protein
LDTANPPPAAAAGDKDTISEGDSDEPLEAVLLLSSSLLFPASGHELRHAAIVTGGSVGCHGTYKDSQSPNQHGRYVVGRTDTGGYNQLDLVGLQICQQAFTLLESNIHSRYSDIVRSKNGIVIQPYM